MVRIRKCDFVFKSNDLTRDKICKSPRTNALGLSQIFPRMRWNLIANFLKSHVITLRYYDHRGKLWESYRREIYCLVERFRACQWGKMSRQRNPLSYTKFSACISYACGKFSGRKRKNFPLAWAMREIRGLHSLGEQKNPRRSWY